MSLRTRIALAAAIAVAVAVVLAAFASYAATARSLRSEIDDSLSRTLQELPPGQGFGERGDRVRRGEAFGGPRPGRLGGAGAFAQLVDGNGNVVRFPPGGEPLPVPDGAGEVAAGAGARYATVRSDGTSVRVLVAPFAPGVAVEVGRPLDEVESTLDDLRRTLILIAGFGIALAALLGLVVAARGVRPVTALAEDVEHVARTHDLGHRIPVHGDDEPARLARVFNELLAGLEEARNAQDQLVADASHELRTPLTALRANVELLALDIDLDPDERRRLAADLSVQLDQFGRLVAGLVELARGARPPERPETLRLDELAADAVARARALAPTTPFTLEAEPTAVVGDRDALERAVANLLDNAVKHGGADAPVEVSVADGAISVRDHGPGVRDDERARLFERFYRGRDAQAVPGSGLGLAIVQQVATGHGGRVEVEAAEGGGARFRLVLPAVANGNGGPPAPVVQGAGGPPRRSVGDE